MIRTLTPKELTLLLNIHTTRDIWEGVSFVNVKTLTDLEKMELIKPGIGDEKPHQHGWVITEKGKGYISYICDIPTDIPGQVKIEEPRKPRWTLLDFDFIDEMAFNMQDGLRDGRQPGDWMEAVKKDPDAYLDKLLRHARSIKYGFDSEREAAAVACNAMILGWLCRQNEKIPSITESLKRGLLSDQPREYHD